MSDWLQRLEKNIQGRRLLRRGGKMLVAVSGGLDSMVLLRVLHALASEWRWKIVVAHFNHQLRGQASDGDEKLVRRTAAALKLPIVVERADVKQFAAKSKLSIEMAARRLRHEFLARAARQSGIRVIVLAHHADDQVELFFLRLLRGAGGEGLAGMKWSAPSPVDRSLTLVRPLLDLTKADLREFARRNKVRFRDDATNFLLTTQRNRIRNELLPLLRRQYQPGVVNAVLRLMDIIGAESEFVSGAARGWLCRRRGNESQTKKSETPSAFARLRRDKHVVSYSFENLPLALQRRVLQLQLTGLGVPVDFELVESLRESAGRVVSVGSALDVCRDAAGRVKLRLSAPAGFNLDKRKVALGKQAGQTDFDGVRLRWKIQSGIAVGRGYRRGGSRGRSPHQIEYFDADKVGGAITLRHWAPGDRFRPIGLKSAVKLQDWFVNQKIPRARRRELAVAVAESGEIFWIEGQRIGESFKLTGRTRRRLIWDWRRTAGARTG